MTDDLACLDPAVFDTLQVCLNEQGPLAACDRLIAELRKLGQYGSLFYALLLRKRVELGVSPIPTGAASELPVEVHETYETAIREAAREVGRLHLDRKDLLSAWNYYRLIGEPQPIAEALETYEPGEDEDAHAIIEIAFQQGVHPRRGFDLVLSRLGICSAITMAGYEMPHGPEVRLYCVRQLVRALHTQLSERLRGEIERHGESASASDDIDALIAGRDWLFGDEYYHVDVSHLTAVVQMAQQLHDGEELHLARQLCRYGQRLPPAFQQPGDPPFENFYGDSEIYLSVLAGDNVEAGLAHFRAKLEDPEATEGSTFPAEVLVNLLVRLGRHDEALTVARTHLAEADERQFSCPRLYELAQQTKQYTALADAARQRNDVVHYLAGLIAARQ